MKRRGVHIEAADVYPLSGEKVRTTCIPAAAAPVSPGGRPISSGAHLMISFVEAFMILIAVAMRGVLLPGETAANKGGVLWISIGSEVIREEILRRPGAEPVP